MTNEDKQELKDILTSHAEGVKKQIEGVETRLQKLESKPVNPIPVPGALNPQLLSPPGGDFFLDGAVNFFLDNPSFLPSHSKAFLDRLVPLMKEYKVRTIKVNLFKKF